MMKQWKTTSRLQSLASHLHIPHHPKQRSPSYDTSTTRQGGIKNESVAFPHFWRGEVGIVPVACFLHLKKFKTNLPATIALHFFGAAAIMQTGGRLTGCHQCFTELAYERWRAETCHVL